MYVMTDAYGSLRFSAIFSASLLFTLVHSGVIPPVVVKTRGLNEDFSMSITLWLYINRHLMIFSVGVEQIVFSCTRTLPTCTCPALHFFSVKPAAVRKLLKTHN